MRVAIMQPTYLPWIGYFALMDLVDTFIILDSVQFSKRSWQQRNQIKTAGGTKWLTVPVLSKGKREQLISVVKIDQSRNFSQNHIRTLEVNYRKAPYFKAYSESIFKLLKKHHESLSSLSVDLIILLRDLLGINTKLQLSSEFKVEGLKDDLLSDLCSRVGATEYISPPGSKVYLDVSEAFERQQTQIRYFDYKHPQYPQMFDDFVPYMSIIDVLFNCGPESLTIIKKGIKI